MWKQVAFLGLFAAVLGGHDCRDGCTKSPYVRKRCREAYPRLRLRHGERRLP